MALVLRLHHGGRRLKDNTRYAASQLVQRKRTDNGTASREAAPSIVKPHA
jgi:hypothetical protein